MSSHGGVRRSLTLLPCCLRVCECIRIPYDRLHMAFFCGPRTLGRSSRCIPLLYGRRQNRVRESGVDGKQLVPAPIYLVPNYIVPRHVVPRPPRPRITPVMQIVPNEVALSLSLSLSLSLKRDHLEPVQPRVRILFLREGRERTRTRARALARARAEERERENGRRSQFADKSVEAFDNFVQVWLLQVYPAISVVVSRFFAARWACPVHSAPVCFFGCVCVCVCVCNKQAPEPIAYSHSPCTATRTLRLGAESWRCGSFPMNPHMNTLHPRP